MVQGSSSGGSNQPPKKRENLFAPLLSVADAEVLKREVAFKMPWIISELANIESKLPYSSNLRFQLSGRAVLDELSKGFYQQTGGEKFLPCGMTFAALREHVMGLVDKSRLRAMALHNRPSPPKEPVPEAKVLPFARTAPRDLPPLELTPEEIEEAANVVLQELMVHASTPTVQMKRIVGDFRMRMNRSTGLSAEGVRERLHLTSAALRNLMPDWNKLMDGRLALGLGEIENLLKTAEKLARKAGVKSASGSMGGKRTREIIEKQWFREPVTIVEYVLGLDDALVEALATPRRSEALLGLLQGDISLVERALADKTFQSREKECHDLLVREFLPAARAVRGQLREVFAQPTQPLLQAPESPFSSAERNLIAAAHQRGEMKAILPDGRRVYLREIHSPLTAIREAIAARNDEFARTGVWWPQLGAFMPTRLAPLMMDEMTPADIQDALADIDARWDDYMAAQRAKPRFEKLAYEEDEETAKRKQLLRERAQTAAALREKRRSEGGRPGTPGVSIRYKGMVNQDAAPSIDDLLNALDPDKYRFEDGELRYVPPKRTPKMQASKPRVSPLSSPRSGERDIAETRGLTREAIIQSGRNYIAAHEFEDRNIEPSDMFTGDDPCFGPLRQIGLEVDPLAGVIESHTPGR